MNGQAKMSPFEIIYNYKVLLFSEYHIAGTRLGSELIIGMLFLLIIFIIILLLVTARTDQQDLRDLIIADFFH